MISLQEVEIIHQQLIDRFGGSGGIRDLAGLESALTRPFQTFDSVELYPSLLAKAAALIESILVNHPFVDGNKRTGYVLMRAFLISNQMDIQASQEEKYSFVINIASGRSSFEEILDWLMHHVEKISS